MRRLIIVRPEPGASASVRAASDMGLEATAMPLFEVAPLEWEPPQLREFDGVLLTSANALRHGGERLKELRGLPAYCVGEPTAAAAREAGFDIAASGSSGVDALLSSIEADLRLLHLCGADRREPDRPRQSIQPLPVYSATELSMPKGLAAIAGTVVAIHSARAGERLARLADEARIERDTVAVAAISEGAARGVGQGWAAVEAAERPCDSALLALACRLCKKPS